MVSMARTLGMRASFRLLHTAGASAAAVPEALPVGAVPLSLAAFGIWGSNTGVGKTLLSAGLAAASASQAAADAAGQRAPALLYLKPLQTGLPTDSDGHFVAGVASAHGAAAQHDFGPHALAALSPSEAALTRESSAAAAPVVLARTLFGWRGAVGPHLAAEREGCAHVSVVSSVVICLLYCAPCAVLNQRPAPAPDFLRRRRPVSDAAVVAAVSAELAALHAQTAAVPR